MTVSALLPSVTGSGPIGINATLLGVKVEAKELRKSDGCSGAGYPLITLRKGKSEEGAAAPGAAHSANSSLRILYRASRTIADVRTRNSRENRCRFPQGAGSHRYGRRAAASPKLVSSEGAKARWAPPHFPERPFRVLSCGSFRNSRGCGRHATAVPESVPAFSHGKTSVGTPLLQRSRRPTSLVPGLAAEDCTSYSSSFERERPGRNNASARSQRGVDRSDTPRPLGT